MNGSDGLDESYPSDLRHLSNLIDDAESEVTIDVLRKIIHFAADEADSAGVISLAKSILASGIAIENGRRARNN